MSKQKGEGKRRVVFVLSAFPKVSETFIVHNFTGLLRKGWDVHVVCDHSDNNDWVPFRQFMNRQDHGSRVHVNWPHVPRFLEVVLFPFAFLACLFRNFSAVVRYLGPGFKKSGFRTLNNLYLDSGLIWLKPDAVYFEFADLATRRMHLKELLGCKILAAFRGHEINFVGLEDPNFYSVIWNNADGIRFGSVDLLSRSRARGFSMQKPHVVILPSVDSKYFEPGDRMVPDEVGTEDRPMRILSVARLAWSKGYEYGHQAVKTLTDRGIRCEYRIVGDGPHKQAIQFAIADLGLNPVVKLLGAKSSAEVKSEMEWADVFLHPSISEGFGVGALEAQAMELPVVCTDADGLRENVSDGETGYVVPRRSAESLAEKLFVLARDPVLRKQMGKAGRKRATTQFEMEEEISALDQFLSSILTPRMHLRALSEEPAHQLPKGLEP